MAEVPVGTLREAPGLVLAIFSPQNIDRLVTIYRAALRSDRDFVMDLYTAAIAAATGDDSIPQASWDRVRVYLPRAQRKRVIAKAGFARTDAVRSRRIYPEELAARRSELVTIFRASMLDELLAANCLDGAVGVWSMWPGYLDEPSGMTLRHSLEGLRIPLHLHHSSGHAFVPDLQRLATAMRPERVVPIHTFAAHRFASLFPRVELHADGHWWDA